MTISTGTNVNIPSNNILNLGAGTITNNGNINLNSTNNATELIVAGSTTLSGTGTVTMSNNPANFIFGGGTLTNNETIQGAGDIGNGNLTLVNNAIIDANQPTALTINPNGGTTNTNTLEATAGGTLVLLTDAITNTGGTILATGAGSTVQLNNTSITGGTLTSSSGGAFVSVNANNQGGPTLNNLTISSGTIVDIPNNNILNLGTGTITNKGTINLQSSNNNTELVITGGNVTLTGGGNVTMSDNGFNFIFGGTAGLTLTNVNNTISGSGNIGNGNMVFVNDAGGTVDATSAHGNVLTVVTGTNGATNLGLFEATAGGTLQLENTLANTGGTILATGAGAAVWLNNVSISGGTLTSNSGGLIESVNANNQGGPTLTSLTISSGTNVDVPNNDILNLGAGIITNNGTINIQSSNNSTQLFIAGSTTLAGTGTVTMSNNTANVIFGGGTLTNNETIQGGGDIGNNSLTLINNGTIDANQPASLTINPNGGTTNTKTMEATAGGTLYLLNYNINNAGGTILATGAGATVDLNNVSITGGTLTSSSGGAFVSVDANNQGGPTLTNLTISSGTMVDIPNNNILNLGIGTITNQGTINLQSSNNSTQLKIAGNVTLAGTGKVIFSNNSNNVILGSGTLTNQNTIQGAGNIGAGQIALVNTGTILGDDSNALVIDTNGTGFSNNSGSKNGTLTVNKGDTLIITGGPFNNFSAGTLTGGIYKIIGTLEFAGGSTGIVTNDAAITLTGNTAEIFNSSNSANALSGFADNASGGTFTLAAATFTDANVFSNSGTIAVGTGAKFNSSNQLTNFNSTTSTLTGGTYMLTGTGQFQFNNQGDASDIVTNDAHIILAGVDTSKSPLIDQSGNNALANFTTNGSSGNLTLTTNRNFATTGGLSNAGTINIQKSTGSGHTQLTIGGTGNYTQTGGTTTVDGLLTTAGAINISSGFVYGNAGTLTGAFDLTGGTLNPGDGIKKAGVLNITGSYTESGSGILNIDLGGTTAGTNYDVLNVSGAAGLGGTLNVDLLTGFTPVAGNAFDILNYTSDSGTFTTTNLPTVSGDHWTIAYGATGVVLTLVAGPTALSPQSLRSSSIATSTATKQSGAALTVSTREPSRIPLTDEACSGWRILSSFSCVRKASSRVTNSATMRPTQAARTEINAQREKIAIGSTVRSSGGARTAATPSPFTISVPSFNVCVYVPSGMARMMGCR